MAQYVNDIECRQDNLSLIPGSYKVARKRKRLAPKSCSLISKHTPWYAHACIHTSNNPQKVVREKCQLTEAEILERKIMVGQQA